MSKRYAVVVVVEAKDSEAAWQLVADGLHAGADDSPVHYVGAPWEGVPEDWSDLITDGIALGDASSEGVVELTPCDPAKALDALEGEGRR